MFLSNKGGILSILSRDAPARVHPSITSTLHVTVCSWNFLQSWRMKSAFLTISKMFESAISDFFNSVVLVSNSLLTVRGFWLFDFWERAENLWLGDTLQSTFCIFQIFSLLKSYRKFCWFLVSDIAMRMQYKKTQAASTARNEKEQGSFST